MTETILPAKIS